MNETDPFDNTSPRLPDIPDRLTELATKQEQLHEAVCHLADRLEPLLRHEPQAECGDKPGFLTSVPLAESLDRQVARTSGTHRIVMDVLDRLEL